MELIKLTNEPSTWQVLTWEPSAGYRIGFGIDLASHELLLVKQSFTVDGKRTLFYMIHLMADGV